MQYNPAPARAPRLTRMKEETLATPTKAAAKPYKVFISYSHAADGRLAPELESALKKFAKPWYRGSAVRTFRDESNLNVSSDLPGKIRAAIRDSEFFLLLASPGAANSHWVKLEVKTFLESNTSERLLIVLTGGSLVWNRRKKDFVRDAACAFPDVGRRVFRSEPLWKDLREVKGEAQLSIRNPVFSDAVASISSTIRGIPLDKIKGRDVIEHKRTKRTAWAAALTLVLLFVAAVVAAYVAKRQAGVATARRIAAESALLSARQPNLLGVSALLASEALRRSPSVEAQETLAAALQLLPHSAAVVRHRGPVNAVAFTGDGDYVVTGGEDGRVLVSEARGGKLVAELKLDSPLKIIAAGADGSSVTAVTRFGEVAAWRWRDGDAAPLRFDLGIHVTAYAVSGEGLFLAAATEQDSKAHALDVYALGTGERLASVKPKSDSVIKSVAFSVGGEYLAAGDDAGGLTLFSGWKTKSPRVALSLRTSGEVTRIIFDFDSRHVAAATSRDTLHVWDVKDGREVANANVDFVLKDIAYDATGGYIAGGSEDATARVWSVSGGGGGLQTARPQAQLVNGGAVNVVAFCYDFDQRFERYVATASDDGTARLWDYSINSTHSQSRERVRMPHGAPVRAIAFSSKGKLIATAGDDGAAHVWDFQSTPSLVQFRNPLSSRQLVAFREGRDVLLTAGIEGLLYSWEPGGKRIEEWVFGSSHNPEVALSPGGAYLATVKGRELSFIDTSSKKTVSQVRLPGFFKEMSFGEGGRYLAVSFIPEEQGESARYDSSAPASVAVVQVASPGDLKLLDAASGGYAVAVSPGGEYVARFTKWSEPRVVARHAGVVRDVRDGRVVFEGAGGAAMSAVAFSRDGRRMAVGVGNVVELRELPSGRVLSRMRHRDTVYSLAFSDGSEYLASAGADATLRVWAVPDGAELSRTQMPRPASQLAFSASGKYLATFAEGGSAQVWLWRPEDLIAEAAERLPANLSADEWRRYVGDEPYTKTFPNLPVPDE